MNKNSNRKKTKKGKFNLTMGKKILYILIMVSIIVPMILYYSGFIGNNDSSNSNSFDVSRVLPPDANPNNLVEKGQASERYLNETINYEQRRSNEALKKGESYVPSAIIGQSDLDYEIFSNSPSNELCQNSSTKSSNNVSKKYINGYDQFGYDVTGCNRQGLTKTGNKCTPLKDRKYINGYDQDGFDRSGCNRQGVDRDGKKCNPLKERVYTNGYDQFGYDVTGCNRQGLTKTGKKCTPLKDRKYINGYDQDGFDRSGCNRQGVDRDGKKCMPLSQLGYDENGCSYENLTIEGDPCIFDPSKSLYDKEGYDKEGYDVTGCNRQGKTKSGKECVPKKYRVYDEEGYDQEGFDKSGCSREGLNREGKKCIPLAQQGYDQNGIKRLISKGSFFNDPDLQSFLNNEKNNVMKGENNNILNNAKVNDEIDYFNSSNYETDNNENSMGDRRNNKSQEGFEYSKGKERHLNNGYSNGNLSTLNKKGNRSLVAMTKKDFENDLNNIGNIETYQKNKNDLPKGIFGIRGVYLTDEEIANISSNMDNQINEINQDTMQYVSGNNLIYHHENSDKILSNYSETGYNVNEKVNKNSKTNEKENALSILNSLGIKPGDKILGRVATALNSDFSSQVVIDLVGYKINGWRMLGELNVKNDYLVIELDRLIDPKGKIYTGMKSLVINRNTEIPAVRTDYDSHFLERWGSLVAASFVKGFGEATSKSGGQTTINSSSITTTNPKYSFGEQTVIASGEVAKAAEPIIKNNFNRKTTVILNKNEIVGILVM